MATPKVARCPTCGRITPWEGNSHRPFCSDRCRLADLGNWAGERYRIAGEAVDPDPASESEDQDD